MDLPSIDQQLEDKLKSLHQGDVFIWRLERKSRQVKVAHQQPAEGSWFPSLFGPPTRETVWETDEEMMVIVNKICSEYNLKIINIETIVKYLNEYVHTDEVSGSSRYSYIPSATGYKVFVKKQKPSR